MRYGPEDFEMGDEPIEVNVKKPIGVIVSIRVPDDQREALFDLAKKRGLFLSQLCRLAMTEYLARAQQPPPGMHITAGTTGDGSLTVVVNGAGGNRTEGGQTRPIIECPLPRNPWPA